MAVKFLPPTEIRLGQIWDYTCTTWGESQADLYIRELMAFIHQLPQQPSHWKSLNDPNLPGVWFMRYRHHVVFFRKLDAKSLGVITILHAEMDLPARLREEIEDSE